MKSVEEKLMDFFYDHPTEIWDSGELQRLEWRGKRGTVQKPRTIVRRLQELCEEGKIENVGTMQSAKYKLKGAKPQKPIKGYVKLDGIRQTVY